MSNSKISHGLPSQSDTKLNQIQNSIDWTEDDVKEIKSFVEQMGGIDTFAGVCTAAAKKLLSSLSEIERQSEIKYTHTKLTDIMNYIQKKIESDLVGDSVVINLFNSSMTNLKTAAHELGINLTLNLIQNKTSYDFGGGATPQQELQVNENSPEYKSAVTKILDCAGLAKIDGTRLIGVGLATLLVGGFVIAPFAIGALSATGFGAIIGAPIAVVLGYHAFKFFKCLFSSSSQSGGVSKNKYKSYRLYKENGRKYIRKNKSKWFLDQNKGKYRYLNDKKYVIVLGKK